MSDSWLQWVGGIGVLILGWIGKRLHDRVDLCVSREEMNKTLDEMRQERREMHVENRDMLDRIHERVDQLWERDR